MSDIKIGKYTGSNNPNYGNHKLAGENNPNYGKRGTGTKLSEGIVIAIEPMINLGTYRVKILSDGWTTITQDKLPSAHYENTIVITEDGYEILTKYEGEKIDV